MLRNFKFFIFLFFLSLNFNIYSYAHMRGTFLSEEDAEKRSLELGCEGIHKNQDKWMPCKNEKELHIYLRKQMERLKTNKRKIHRKITSISAIPLLITIVSGTIYSILQPLGVDAFWLIKWHTGNFGIINLQPFYSIFLGIVSIISIISGLNLLQTKTQIYSKLGQKSN